MKITVAKSIIRNAILANLELAKQDNPRNSSFVTPFIVSDPGLGKSTMVTDLVKELGLQQQDLIVAQFDAAELAGFPMLDAENKSYERARPFFLPTEGEGVLFLDELPQAVLANLNVVAQLVNERRIGEHVLPKGWTIVCAGNPMSAKAGTVSMPSHLRDRLMYLDIDVCPATFREYALSQGFLPEVTTYVHERPEWLSKFDPKQDSCPSPRSWERVNSILQWKMSPEEEYNAIQGVIGEAAVSDFIAYRKVWTKLPRFEEIIKDPKNHSIPTDTSILYALCSLIAHKSNANNMDDVMTYIHRFENKEFSSFCMKDTIQRNPELKKVKSVKMWLLGEGKDLLL